MRSKKIQPTFDDRSEPERFKRLKHDAKQRMDTDYLTDAAFLSLMMDVYQHHLSSTRGGLDVSIRVELFEEKSGKMDIVRDTGIDTSVSNTDGGSE